MASAQLENESVLVAQLRGGSEQAFETLYRHYAPQLYRNVLKLIKDEESTRELLQRLFLTVWQRRGSLDPERSFVAYLFTIARNQVYDTLRHRQTARLALNHLGDQPEGYEHVEQQLTYRETLHRVQHAIEQLPPRRREVFTLCKLDGKSYGEVAGLLGITVSAVNAHVVKATRAIREQLDLPEILLVGMLAGALAG